MALKSKEWFFKQCLLEAKDYTAFAHLAWGLLEKGVGQEDATRGHVTQAIGAVQRFLARRPQHRQTIADADRTRPFDMAADDEMLQDWREWFEAERAQRAARQGAYGREDFGYNLETLAGYLTRRFGGRRQGGGGGVDEFKKVLRLVPEFWDRD